MEQVSGSKKMSASSSAVTGSEQMQCLQLFGEEVDQLLSDGFLQLFQPELLRVQDSLRELTVNQEEMLHSIQQKREGLEEMSSTTHITDTLQKVPSYRAKLASLSREMQLLSRRARRLQSRAGKLKEGRVQRELLVRRDLQHKAEQERLLEARPAK